MSHQSPTSSAEAKLKSIFNTGESLLPFVVAGIFLILLNTSFLKIRGLTGWNSLLDIKDSLSTILYSLAGNSPVDIRGFTDSILGGISSVFWGLVIGSFLIAFGRYFLHTRLAALGVLGLASYGYVVSKLATSLEDFIDFGRTAGIGQALGKIDFSMLQFSTPVGIGLLACLAFLAFTGVKVSTYVAFRSGYAKLNGSEGWYEGVSETTRKNLSRAATFAAIPVCLILVVLLKGYLTPAHLASGTFSPNAPATYGNYNTTPENY